MQFKVPQFIDIEDKVIGPLTIKQFVYLAGGGGLAYLGIRLLPAILALFIVPIIIGLALALAFFKYNEKPFINALESMVRFYTKSRLYLWHPNTTKKVAQAPTAIAADRTALTESKLKTLSWSLDVIDTNNK